MVSTAFLWFGSIVLESCSTSYYTGWRSDCDSIVRNVPRDYRSCSDQHVLPNSHSRSDCRACANRRVTLHSCLEKLPFTMRSRMLVIREGHVRSDEHIIFNCHASRYEDEWTNLAIVAYCHSCFNVDVRVYLRILSDLATVKVHLIVDARPVAQASLFDDGVSRPSHPARIFSSIGTSTGTVRSWINDSFAAS